MSAEPSVRIVEVGPRDGLQNIKQSVPLEVKIEMIQRLSETGIKVMEPTSVVSPKAIPQLQDNRLLLAAPPIKRLMGDERMRMPVLVPNVKGLEIARTLGVKEVGVFVSATEGFSRANTNCTVAEGLQRAREIARRAISLGMTVRGAVSCIFSDPYDGPTDPRAVLRVVQELLSYGCYEVALGDTVGVGCPEDVRSLLRILTGSGVDVRRLAGHFHDTYGQAVANVWAAFECGVRTFDSSVSGLGGCPFAPGAKGNLATEDLVYSFHKAGVQTGIELSKLSATGAWISQTLRVPNSSRAGQAIAAKETSLTDNHQEPVAPRLDWKLLEKHSNLEIWRSGANLKIVLCRAQNGNALTSEMVSQLKSCVQRSASDPTISRIVLTAKGKFFCTGMDLKKNEEQSQSVKGKQSDYDMFTELFETINSAPQVTIACINGPCYAGGIGLAFACDIRIAIENATVTLSEAKLGLCPAIISKHVVREWGPSFAREAMLSGRPIPMSELKTIGAVHVLVKDTSQLEHQLDSYLHTLKRCAPGASSMCKSVVEVAWSHPGGRKQEETIRGCFEGMMGPGTESEIGLAGFRNGKKSIDWDALKSKQARSRL